jgi:hypothetical protein
VPNTPTIELQRKDLDKSIEVLSSAAQALQLTVFERISYRVLMVSVDVAIVSLVAVAVDIFSLVLVSKFSLVSEDSEGIFLGLLFSAFIVFFLSLIVGILSLMLNIPLFIRAFRETARLKALGLSSLSTSLWIESRRSRWLSRSRGFLLIVISILFGAFGVGTMFSPLTSSTTREDRIIFFSIGLFYMVVVGLLLGARYLRNRRERIDLTANAAELKKAFQSLRERAGENEVVAVPSELLKQTARIESARIAKERTDAVLQSMGSASLGEYAVAFDRGAVEQRSKLDIADRTELEDLAERLSAEAAELESRGGGTAETLQAATESKRIEINYVIDRRSRRIGIMGVRQVGGREPSSNGAGHA